ncbi:helix-turn-helix domain-containing protein [Tenacibaculum sp.]|nr:helix-turn-helix domain-containing protein [Tenacibaculum sp.]
MSFYNTLIFTSIITSLHTFLLSIYFFTRERTKQKEHLIFSFVLILFSLLIISNTVSITDDLLESYPKTIFLSRHLSLLIIPLVYIYIKVILLGKSYKLKDYLKHFALFIVTTPILIIILTPIKEFDIYFSNLRFVSGFLILFQNCFYFVLIYKLIKKGKEKKKLIDKIRWSKTLLIGFLFIWMIQFCSFILIDIYKEYYICPYTISMYSITVFVIIYVFIFFLLETKKIISHKSKYNNSSLSESQTHIFFEKIQTYFKDSKPFLDNEFSISKLSEDIKIPIKQISQVINSSTDGNFNDFVNNHRLKESEILLLTNSKEKLTISEIYYAVGFNSRSTFYELFKKKHGQTPSELRKKNMKYL